MSRIEFRIHSPRGEQWQRLKEHSQPRNGLDWAPIRGVLARIPLGRALLRSPVPVTAGVGVAVFAAWSGVFAPAQIHGVPISATHMLVLVDDTGSMSEAGIPTELERQRKILAASFFSSNELKIYAFGVSSAGYHNYGGYASNLLYRLSDELPAHPGVDSVYVFSDFHPEEAGADCDNTAGLAQFQALIGKSRVRLYLSSVNMLPSEGLLAIAEESGGGLIATGAKSSLSDRAKTCGANQ
jgi:hypothetical protein